MDRGSSNNDPGDRPKLLVVLLVSVWALVWGGSFLAFALAEPTGEGFVKGLNRVGLFLGWQAVAALLAIGAWGVSRRWPKGSAVRRLAALPFFLAMALVVGLIVLVVWARFAG